MKLNWTHVAIAGLGALLLSACGGKSSSTPAPAKVLSITTTNGAGTSTTFDATSANSVISAHTNAVENRTYVEICGDVDKDQDCSQLIVLTIEGTTAGTRSLTSPDALSQINYHDDETETGVISHYMSSDGSISVTEVGANVKGTFTAALACNSGCSGNVSVSGTFDVPLDP